MRKKMVCEECEASYEIKHDMDTDYFVIEHCPFCGAHQESDEYVSYEEEYDE